MILYNKIMVNSHIQVPKSLLKNFSKRIIEIKDNLPIKKRCVYSLNLKSKNIDHVDIKELNTELGYYSDKIESQLSIIESEFGECVVAVIDFMNQNFNKTNKTFEIYKYEQTIKRFILYSIARTKKIKSTIQEKGEFYKEYPEYYTHSKIVEKTEEVYNNLTLLDDYSLTVMYTENYQFVLPKYCWYGGFIDKETIVLPFSPKYTFVLFPNKNISKYLSDGVLGVITCDTEEVKVANRIALIHEQKADNEFIVAQDEQELRDLIPFIK